MIAVTGANGLVGSSIIRKLIANQESFVAVKRSNSDISLLQDVQDKITWRDADILDTVALNEALRDVSTIIHAAAIISYNKRDKKKIFNVNVTGTRNVVNASLVHGIKRFVHVSSVSAIGRPKGKQHLDENEKWVDNPITSNYARSKYAAELEVMRGNEEGLNAVIVNPSVILGPGNWSKSSARIFEYVWNEKPFYTTGLLNYVSLQDVTDIIYTLLYSTHRGERFILNAGTIAFKSLFDTIATYFNKKSPTIRLSGEAIRIIAWGEHFRSLVTGANPLITRETALLAGSPVLYNNEKVKSKLKFEFQSIDLTLKWCCEYYLRQANGENK